MTAEHTPGPWTWETVEDTGLVIQHTLKGPDVLCRYWHDKDQGPDARLIRAAPDLLKALDGVLPYMTLPTDGPDMEAADAAYKMAVSAISKATTP